MEDSETLITPPSSPRLALSSIKGKAMAGSTHGDGHLGPISNCNPHFNCQGDVASETVPVEFSESSYLRNNDIKTYISITDDAVDLEQQPSTNSAVHTRFTWNFFGLSYNVTSDISSDLTHLFDLAKRNFSGLKCASIANSKKLLFGTNQPTSNKQPYELRWDVCMFLNFLKTYINEWCERYEYYVKLASELRIVCDDPCVFVSKVLKELKDLLLYIGDAAELPSHVLQAGVSRSGNNSSSPSYHLFHLWLDIWWSVTVMFFVMEKHMKGFDTFIKLYDSAGATSLSSQAVYMLIQNCISIAEKRYCDMYQNTDHAKVSMFPCVCVQELWVLLIHLIEAEKLGNKEAFWVYLHQIFESVLSSEGRKPKINVSAIKSSTCFTIKPSFYLGTSKSQNPILFSLWLLKDLTPLFFYDASGKYMHKETVLHNYSELNKMLSNAFSDQRQFSEMQLQWILHYCICITRHWEPNVDFMLLLCDYFLKRLDENFFQAGMMMNHLQVMYKTGISWLEQIKENVASISSSVKPMKSSLYVFFHLLHVHVKKIFDKSCMNQWKHFQGRLYLKFHPKKLKDLTDKGLQNCFSFLLTLAEAGALEPMSKKVLDLCVLLDDQLPVSKRLVMWKALFAFIHLAHQKSSSDIVPLIKQIAKSFENVTVEMSNLSKTSEHYLNLLMMCDACISEIKTIVDNSIQLEEPLYPFFGFGFVRFLKNVASTKAEVLLDLVENVLVRLVSLKSISKSASAIHQNHQLLADNCYQHIFPYISSNLMLGNVSQQVIDMAVIFIRLSLVIPPTQGIVNKDILPYLFQQITENKKFSAVHLCRFLCRILTDKAIFAKLQEKVRSCQTSVIRTWLRVSLFLPLQQENISKLTNCVLKLSDVVEIMKCLNESNAKDSNKSAFASFFSALGRKLVQTSGSQEESAFRLTATEYMKDFVHSAEQGIREASSKEQLQQIYLLGGCLIHHCSPLLYVKRQSGCLLPLLLDVLLRPPSSYGQDKVKFGTFHPSEYLPGILSGLIRLGIKGDPYLERKARTIYGQYQSVYKNVNVLLPYI